MGFNNLVQMFPSNIVANMFGFKAYDYFKIAEEEKEAPKVKFQTNIVFFFRVKI